MDNALFTQCYGNLINMAIVYIYYKMLTLVMVHVWPDRCEQSLHVQSH